MFTTKKPKLQHEKAILLTFYVRKIIEICNSKLSFLIISQIIHILQKTFMHLKTKDRINYIINEIVDQYTYADQTERPDIGFSGGKDSTALLTLVGKHY
jgi:hypothetical protein